MNIIGLDLSLTATGVATNAGVSTIKVKLPEHANETERMRRLHQLVVRIDRACKGADVVMIEGYSYSSKASRSHALGELGGAVKLVLLQRGTPFVVPSPAVVKKYATNNGGAGKDLMLVTAVKNAPAPFEIETNDQADAWWLYDMAHAHYTNRELPAYKQHVLDAIKFPEIPGQKGAAA